MKLLTPAQEKVVDAIKNLLEVSGLPPTRKELASQLGFKSINAAECHLKAIEKKGYIKLKSGLSRGIFLVENINQTKRNLSTEKELNIPIVGNVAAGAPIQSEENIEKTVLLDANFFSIKPHYLLRVQGDSMIEEGILEGDLLAIEKRNTCRNGEIIVARIEDEVTVKKVFIKENRTELHAANKLYDPIIIEKPIQFFIEGKVVGLIRSKILAT